jgi:pilus assembly protein FimV
LIEKSFQWHKAAASVVVAALGLWLSDATALSLGRVSVQSALGEPLRAEIDMPVITAEESASLLVTVAPPAAYSAAGMEYSAVLAGTQISLVKRSDGRSFLRLSSDRPVNDAFLDIILEATWASGRIVRDFTLLLDPPNLRQPSQQPPASTQLPAVTALPRSPVPNTPSVATTETTASTPASTPIPAPKPAVVAPAPRDNAAGQAQIKVRPGDTAGQIAAAHKPANVSLDQMLVALLRSNPNAFVGNDLNRIKAGALLNLPMQDMSEGGQPARTVIAQSKDFNEYRGKVAANAPQAALAPADRQASGKVQTNVQDERSSAPAPDKLTLSKGEVQAGNSEAQLAKERSIQEAADKAAALARNIEELNKLKASPGTLAPAGGAGASSATRPGSLAVPASGPVTAASPPRPAISAAVGASEDGLLESLIADPAAPMWAAALIGLLAALGLYRIRQRKQALESEEPSFLASRLKPDSFFSAPADDLAAPLDNPATGSSLLNPSSLAKAAGESDPVAEAEVYLAYGRDVQAEEVLREAIRVRPELPGIHQKLLEILAKRRDVAAFNTIAQEMHTITTGQGPDWDRVRDLGLIIDASNPLYLDAAPGMAPELAPDLPTQVDDLELKGEAAADQITSDLDIDLDLDFSVEEASQAPRPANDAPSNNISPDLTDEAPPTVEPVLGRDEPVEPEIEFDLDLGSLAVDAAQAEPDSEALVPESGLADLRFDTADLTLQSETLPNAENSGTRAVDDSPITNPGALEFDFGSLSLELDKTEPVLSEPLGAVENDPLLTKLALADEFAAIGDQEGARALIEEVIEQASGDLQAKAQQALKKL